MDKLTLTVTPAAAAFLLDAITKVPGRLVDTLPLLQDLQAQIGAQQTPPPAEKAADPAPNDASAAT